MKAVIAGATGFIGTHLIALLRDDPTIVQVQVLSRRPIELTSKFKQLQGDLTHPQLEGKLDIAFCALGTTIAVAGSKEGFYHVDHDLVIAFAKAAKSQSVHTFVLVSSLGADATSANYYLKVKGETEEDLKALGFHSLIILRPSLLMGERKEFRFGELVGKGVMTLFNPLMLGPLAKYRGIEGSKVAHAMLQLATENLKGVHVLESDKLQAF